MRDFTPKILIIEDNIDNLNILSEMLNERAYTVRRAINGSIALRSIDQVSPDLILLDILLPDLSGYDLCRQLKANDRTCHIPIIFISALSDPQEKVKAFEMGGSDYITKPFATAEVFARIQNQLQLKAAKAEIETLNSELEKRVQSNVAASIGILAGSTLEKEFINQVLQKEIMQQSVIHQEWKEEFLQEGEQTGILKGKLEGEQSLVLRQLICRIGDVSSGMRSQIQSLPLDQLETLGEALLDFTESSDLVDWLQEHHTD